MNPLNFKTGPRVLTSFAIVLLVMVCITAVALWRLQLANDTTDYLVNDKLSKQQLSADWLGAAKLNGIRALSIAKSDSLEVAEFFQAQLKEGDQSALSIAGKLQRLHHDAEEAALLGVAAEKEHTYLAIRKQIFAFKELGKTQEVEQLADSMLKTSFAAYAAALEQLLNHQTMQAQMLAAQSAAQYHNSRATLLGFGVLALGLGALLAWAITRSIVLPLRHAVLLATRVSQGDLRTIATRHRGDEIGQLFDALQNMTTGLAVTVRQVRDGAHSIDAASRELAIGNHDLSRRTEHQAGALEQTASSMEQLTLAVQQNSTSARQANAVARAASADAHKGGEVVGQVVQTMDQISASAKKIVDIIGVIDGIAFQTNILALNAAVEAARAGEQGRGFAVVATEVRSLAHRSALAAREIKELITDSAGQIDAGSTLVRAAGDTMAHMVASVEKLTGMMGKISVASAEQESGIAQVNGAISAMDGVTQHNAALVEEAAATAEAMHKESRQLAELVRFFKVDEAHQHRALPPAHGVPMASRAKPASEAGAPTARPLKLLAERRAA